MAGYLPPEAYRRPPKRRPAQPHPCEMHDARQIAQATHFTAYIRLGPHETISERHETGAAALDAADRLSREYGTFGRKAGVHAVMANGTTIFVTQASLALAASLKP